MKIIYTATLVLVAWSHESLSEFIDSFKLHLENVSNKARAAEHDYIRATERLKNSGSNLDAVRAYCMNKSKALSYDYIRRTANKKKDQVFDYDPASCGTKYAGSLFLPITNTDLILGTITLREHVGQLSGGALVIRAYGIEIATYHVLAIDVPIVNTNSYPPCFTFTYFGNSIALCAPTTVARDRWINELHMAYFCVADRIHYADANSYALPVRPDGLSNQVETLPEAETDMEPEDKPKKEKESKEKDGNEKSKVQPTLELYITLGADKKPFVSASFKESRAQLKKRLETQLHNA